MANSQKNNDSFAEEVELNQRRIKTADRSSFAQPTGRVRNVRTSSMPGTPLNQDVRSRSTIDEEFLADYEKKGIQPQSITEKEPSQPKTPSVTRNETVAYTNTPRNTQAKVREKEHLKKSLRKKGYKARALQVNIGIVTTGLSLWLLYQLPFALINIISLGMAEAFHFIQSGLRVEETGNVIVRTAGRVWNFAVDFVAAVTAFLPMTFFMVTYLALMAFGILMLFTMYFLYTLRGLNPLFGDGGGTKLGMFLLAIIGYSLPVLNIVPWFLFWAWAVWKYPR